MVIGSLTTIIANTLFVYLCVKLTLVLPPNLFHIAMTIPFLGSLIWILGGYVSARIAKHNEVLNGSLTSLYTLGYWLYVILFTKAAEVEIWACMFSLPITIAFAALGGYLRARQVRAKQVQA